LSWIIVNVTKFLEIKNFIGIRWLTDLGFLGISSGYLLKPVVVWIVINRPFYFVRRVLLVGFYIGYGGSGFTTTQSVRIIFNHLADNIDCSMPLYTVNNDKR
jgi:hypothetical protein